MTTALEAALSATPATANGPVFTTQPVRMHHAFDPVEDAVLPDVGSDFQEATKLHPGLMAFLMGPAVQLWSADYQRVPTDGLATRRRYTRAYPLPEAVPVAASFSQVVAGRVSTSPPGGAGLSAAELATVLFLAYGATQAPGDPRVHRRPVPSGGAAYPLDLYVALPADGCTDGGIPAGLYHYDPFLHCLEQLGEEAGWLQVEQATLAPETVRASSAVVFVVGCFARQTAKYGTRGYRFAYLEAGQVGQNIVLAGTGLGLGVLPYASIFDSAVERALGLDGVHESLVHTVLLGR